MNLAARSRPRTPGHSAAYDEQKRELETRHLNAVALLTWFQSGEEDTIPYCPPIAYCSPVVIQEFYWACAKALLWLYKVEKALAPTDRSPLWQEVDSLLSKPECAALKNEIDRHAGDFAKVDLIQKFLKEVVGIIGREFRAQLTFLQVIPDACEHPEVWLSEFETLLALGDLKANDCVILLTAAGRARAEEFFTDDGDFTKEAVKDFLRQRYRINVRTTAPI
jgi:predicted nucleic acid-binding protein